MAVMPSTVLPGVNAETTGITPFTIEFERTGTMVNMTCSKGCAWTDLSFTLEAYAVQHVNQEGMVSLEEVGEATNNGYLLKLTHKGDDFVVEGITGTAFSELSFGCVTRCKVGLNESGVSVR